MAILDELYFGNICPAEKFVKSGGDYEKVNNNLICEIEKLVSQLNDAQKELFDSIASYATELCGVSERDRYKDGFCTGVKLTLEILNFKSSNFK